MPDLLTPNDLAALTAEERIAYFRALPEKLARLTPRQRAEYFRVLTAQQHEAKLNQAETPLPGPTIERDPDALPPGIQAQYTSDEQRIPQPTPYIETRQKIPATVPEDQRVHPQDVEAPEREPAEYPAASEPDPRPAFKANFDGSLSPHPVPIDPDTPDKALLDIDQFGRPIFHSKEAKVDMSAPAPSPEKAAEAHDSIQQTAAAAREAEKRARGISPEKLVAAEEEDIVTQAAGAVEYETASVAERLFSTPKFGLLLGAAAIAGAGLLFLQSRRTASLHDQLTPDEQKAIHRREIAGHVIGAGLYALSVPWKEHFSSFRWNAPKSWVTAERLESVATVMEGAAVGGGLAQALFGKTMGERLGGVGVAVGELAGRRLGKGVTQLILGAASHAKNPYIASGAALVDELVGGVAGAVTALAGQAIGSKIDRYAQRPYSGPMIQHTPTPSDPEIMQDDSRHMPGGLNIHIHSEDVPMRRRDLDRRTRHLMRSGYAYA